MFRNDRLNSGAPRIAAIAAVALSGMLAAHAAAASAANRSPAARHVDYPVTSYGVHDVGAPGSAYSSFSQVSGFNNTGQLVGAAYPSSGPGYQQCIAFTGTQFVPLQGTATSLNCYPSSGISDANSSGVFTTVGYGNIPTDQNVIGFYSTVGPKSATTTFFPSNSQSELYLENKSGLAAGYTYYNPVAGFSYSYPPVTTTGTTLSLLQPYCTTSATACEYYPYYISVGPGEGGRFINAGGTVFAQALNASNGAYVEYTGGKSPTEHRFSLPPDGSNGATGLVGIDDSGSVAYYEYDTKLAEYLTWTYNPVTKVATNLGTLKGNTCTQWLPLWINGPGRVLGIAQNCSYAGDATYWTWDSKNGMIAVYFNHTGYSTVYARTINDLGQISADLYLSTTGAHNWGYLKPYSLAP